MVLENYLSIKLNKVVINEVITCITHTWLGWLVPQITTLLPDILQIHKCLSTEIEVYSVHPHTLGRSQAGILVNRNGGIQSCCTPTHIGKVPWR